MVRGSYSSPTEQHVCPNCKAALTIPAIYGVAAAATTMIVMAPLGFLMIEKLPIMHIPMWLFLIIALAIGVPSLWLGCVVALMAPRLILIKPMAEHCVQPGRLRRRFT
jgi:hypothetical protein